MKNKLKISKEKANYLVFGGLFLIISTVYVVITEPSKFNFVAGFAAIILFGIGTFIGIDKLIDLKSTESINKINFNRKTSFITIALSFIKSTAIMIAVLLFVYFKNGNINLDSSSWLLIFGVYIVLMCLSAYVKAKDSQISNGF